MSIEQEIRDQIENIKKLKQEVGYINNHLSILEGFCREDKQKQVDDAYKRGYEDGKNSIDKGCDGCRYESRPEIQRLMGHSNVQTTLEYIYTDDAQAESSL